MPNTSVLIPLYIKRKEGLLINYYISDLHLGHKNVIGMDRRPFASTVDMNETIIKNWNNAVTPKDDVYILGDFIWGNAEEWRKLVPEFAGRKHLIRGNHDLKQFPSEIRNMFVDIRDYLEIKDSGKTVILCHYPILFYRGDYKDNVWMLYGHVHATKEYDYITEIQKNLNNHLELEGTGPKGKLINVGCMMPWMNYTPRTLSQITKFKQNTQEKTK